MNKRPVTLEEMHELQLGMMDSIHDYCTRHGLRYSLGGGTLLGAIRHKGFIPWDDDIDIMMPRPDYDKFIAGFAGNYEHYKLQHMGNTKGYHLLFAKIFDDRTVLTEPGLNNGVYIDIFAIDGLPSWEQLPEYYQLYKKYKYVVRMTRYPWSSLNYKEQAYIILHFYRFIVPRCIRLRQLNTLLRSHDFDTAQVAGCITGTYGEKEFMDADVFRDYIDVQFENRTYRAIAAYDAYLTKHYSDYMQLPPEEKRHTHHEFECWWK